MKTPISKIKPGDRIRLSGGEVVTAACEPELVITQKLGNNIFDSVGIGRILSGLCQNGANHYRLLDSFKSGLKNTTRSFGKGLGGLC